MPLSKLSLFLFLLRFLLSFPSLSPLFETEIYIAVDNDDAS